MGSRRGLRTEGETRIPNSNFILGFNDYPVVKRFPVPVEIVASPMEGVEMYQRVLFGEFQVRGFAVCSVRYV